jgi:hypothetical protein
LHLSEFFVPFSIGPSRNAISLLYETVSEHIQGDFGFIVLLHRREKREMKETERRNRR